MKKIAFLTASLFALVCSLAIAQTSKTTQTPQTSQTSQKSQTDQTKNNEQTDPIQIIMSDHKYIRESFGNLDKKLNSNVSESRSMFSNLKDFLKKHEDMEQSVWYPELEKKDELKSIIADMKKEEDAASKAIKDIDDTKDDKQWVSKVKDLQKAVEHHASDEESKLFPKVKKAFDKAELAKIGEKLQKYHTDKNMNH